MRGDFHFLLITMVLLSEISHWEKREKKFSSGGAERSPQHDPVFAERDRVLLRPLCPY